MPVAWLIFPCPTQLCPTILYCTASRNFQALSIHTSPRKKSTWVNCTDSLKIEFKAINVSYPEPSKNHILKPAVLMAAPQLQLVHHPVPLGSGMRHKTVALFLPPSQVCGPFQKVSKSSRPSKYTCIVQFCQKQDTFLEWIFSFLM